MIAPPSPPYQPWVEEALLRLYLDAYEIVWWPPQYEGYPRAWVRQTNPPGTSPDKFVHPDDQLPRIPDLVRRQAGDRCERCHHPFECGVTPGHWSPCDAVCRHPGPIRTRELHLGDEGEWTVHNGAALYIEAEYDEGPTGVVKRYEVQAEWRVLTVHHLNGVKADCRWWNLAALCQRCHLTIQGKVRMHVPFDREHSEWFKIHAAGFYAAEFLGEELTRAEAADRIDEILDPHVRARSLF